MGFGVGPGVGAGRWVLSDWGRLAANATPTLRRYESSPAHPGSSSAPNGGPAGRTGRRRGRRRRRGGRLAFAGAALAAVGVAGVAYKRLAARGASGDQVDDGLLALGWGEGVERPDHAVVRTPDGAQLAVWDLEGGGPDAPVVVLPHCWGCSHEIWLPVARRLREQGSRVVLYDQRGHGASTRGTAPLTVETLAHDLTAVLDATDVHDVVLAGHSMGGMTIMSLATHRPDVLKERAKATVLVATAATSLGEPLDPSDTGGQRAGGVGTRHPGHAVQERARLRARGLRREPGPLAHGPDPGALRRLPRRRAGRLLALDVDDGPPGGRGHDGGADDRHGGHAATR